MFSGKVAAQGALSSSSKAGTQKPFAVGCSDSNFTLPGLNTILSMSNLAVLGFVAHQINLR